MQQATKLITKEELLSRLERVYNAFLEDGRVSWGGEIIENKKVLRAKVAETIEICKATRGCKDITISDWDKLVSKGGEVNE